MALSTFPPLRQPVPNPSSERLSNFSVLSLPPRWACSWCFLPAGSYRVSWARGRRHHKAILDNVFFITSTKCHQHLWPDVNTAWLWHLEMELEFEKWSEGWLGSKNKSFLLPRSSYSCSTEIPALWKSYQIHSCSWVIASSQALQMPSWKHSAEWVKRTQSIPWDISKTGYMFLVLALTGWDRCPSAPFRS